MKPDNRSVKLVDCMTEPAYNMPNVDAQAEEEELPPNHSAEIPDPATVHCDDDVEVKFFILILTFQLYLILIKLWTF